MRPIDVIKQKRRFIMFDDKTKAKVLELVAFFGKYNMHYEARVNKSFLFYDTDDLALLKSNIVLYRTTIGAINEINMASEKNSASNVNFAQRYTSKHFRKEIKAHESLLKHKDFLIDSFKNMFLSAVNFDPEFLMQKLKPVYLIQTVSEEYRSSNGVGLKMTYSFDSNQYTNYQNGIKAKQNILTIYDHSNTINTDAFDDLIGKLTRYIKELTPTDETKIMLARRLTASAPVKPKTFLDDNKDKKGKENKKKK